MINVAEITSTKGVEQAKNRMALEKKKANEERRKFENHHKYMMGGAVHKYFKECFSFEESEINEILEVAFKTSDCPSGSQFFQRISRDQRTVRIRRAFKKAVDQKENY